MTTRTRTENRRKRKPALPCGHPTTNGEPCKNIVDNAKSGLCWHHEQIRQAPQVDVANALNNNVDFDPDTGILDDIYNGSEYDSIDEDQYQSYQDDRGRQEVSLREQLRNEEAERREQFRNEDAEYRWRSPREQERLLRNYPHTAEALTRNKNATPSVLHQIVLHEEVAIDTKVAAMQHVDCYQGTVNQAATDPNPALRAAVAGLGPQFCARSNWLALVNDPDPQIRAGAAGAPFPHWEYVEQFVKDPDPEVRLALAENDDDSMVSWQVGDLTKDPDPSVRAAAVMHRQCLPSRRRSLRRDPDPTVRAAADSAIRAAKADKDSD